MDKVQLFYSSQRSSLLELLKNGLKGEVLTVPCFFKEGGSGAPLLPDSATEATMTQIRAVLFDFGGTLYDYRALAAGEQASLVELARWAGVKAEPQVIHRTYRAALKQLFATYLTQSYYLHRDFFRDVLLKMAEELRVVLTEEQITRYWALQREWRARDFALRSGALDTLMALRVRGLYLGIVSNADEDQLTHMVELGWLARYCDSWLSSEKAQSCKPDLAIFTEALRQAGCAPEEALFVGDSIQQDIAGANRAGLRSVLIWSDAHREPPEREQRPWRVIRSIPELLPLVP